MINHKTFFKIKVLIRNSTPKFLFFNKLNKPTILIFGMRRGATTLFAEMLSDNKTRLIGQPLGGYYENKPYRKKRKEVLGHRYLHQYLKLCDKEKSRIENFILEINDGKFSKIDLNWGLIKNRVVFKFNNAHLLMDIFVNRPSFYSIILLRHPLTQSLSNLRNNWNHIYPAYLQDNNFSHKLLTSHQKKLFNEIHTSNDRLSKYLLDWYCQYIYYLKYLNYVTFIFYERLLISPEKEISKLDKNIIKFIDLKKLNVPSKSSKFSIAQIRNSDDNKVWTKRLFNNSNNFSDSQKKNILNIFKVLKIKFYEPFNPLPLDT